MTLIQRNSAFEPLMPQGWDGTSAAVLVQPLSAPSRGSSGQGEPWVGLSLVRSTRGLQELRSMEQYPEIPNSWEGSGPV